MMENNPILQLVDVTKKYASSPGAEAPLVLDGVSLEVGRGESIAVVGPSGCGKSTLLNIMGTLDRPTSGEVTLEGERLNNLQDKQLAHIRSKRIGFVFQNHHLLPQCTVLENVLIPTLALSKRTTPEAGERARGLLERVGLEDRMKYRPGLLSGGERQRVAVVRALINRPSILLADEPTGALDRATAQKLVELLCELNREENVTLIVVTHSRQLASRMSQVYELATGKLSPVDIPR